MAAERPLVDAPVGAPRPGYSPVIQQHDLAGYFDSEAHGDVLVAEEIGAAHGIPGVKLNAVTVLRLYHRRGAALGAYRVRAHKLYLGYNSDIGLRILAGDLYGCP